jgi:hypothetical protein
MKLVPLILFLAAAGTASQTPAPGGRRDWIDPTTYAVEIARQQ